MVKVAGAHHVGRGGAGDGAERGTGDDSHLGRAEQDEKLNESRGQRHVLLGPAKAAVISSAAFGTISGAAAANVVGTGPFTIPSHAEAAAYPPQVRRRRGKSSAPPPAGSSTPPARWAPPVFHYGRVHCFCVDEKINAGRVGRRSFCIT
ncbi:MAG: TRAP transporter large permease subunit [Dysosmobacter sp.]